MKFTRKLLNTSLFVVLMLVANTCSYTSSDQDERFTGYDPFNWETSTLRNEGLDSLRIENALSKAYTLDYIHSLLIVKNGKLVFDKYFSEYKRTDPHVVRSVSKSFLSTLVGFVYNQGNITSIDQKIFDIAPEYFLSAADPRIKDVTIRHLLTMGSGIKGDQEFYSEAFGSDNWIKRIMSEPLLFDPGTDFKYSTAATHLLAVVLEDIVGEDLLRFANSKLFNPMRIEVADWEQDPQGNYFGGNNMFFVPRDMAAFGNIILNNGYLGEETIIPSGWIEEALEDHLNEPGIDWGELTDIGYGYLWWMGELGDFEVKLAIGHGGQFIILVPAADMVIVTTAEAYLGWDEADEHERGILDLVANYVLPAVL